MDIQKNYKDGFIARGTELRKITEWPQTEVFSLENLPKRITDRFHDGFVLKHVSDPLWEARETMGGDVLWASRCQSAMKNLSERDKHELSVEELAAYIESRLFC